MKECEKRMLKLTNKLLGTKSEPWDFENPPMDPQKLYQDMVKIMMDKKALGLSAIQVGIPYRVFIFGNYYDEKEIYSAFNPKIVDFGPEMKYYDEGCLSFPGIFCKIKRHTEIRARFSDWQNNTDTFKFREVTAQVFQHEYDHLEGITFRQRANSIHWQKAKKEKLKLDRIRKKNEREKRTFI